MGLEKKDYLEAVMGLIMNGGDSKGRALEAIEAAKAGNFELATNKLKEANDAQILAHKSQTNLLAQEAEDGSVEISMLLIHGQDHLMNAITFLDLAKEIVCVYEKMSQHES